MAVINASRGFFGSIVHAFKLILALAGLLVTFVMAGAPLWASRLYPELWASVVALIPAAYRTAAIVLWPTLCLMAIGLMIHLAERGRAPVYVTREVYEEAERARAKEDDENERQKDMLADIPGTIEHTMKWGD